MLVIQSKVNSVDICPRDNLYGFDGRFCLGGAGNSRSAKLSPSVVSTDASLEFSFRVGVLSLTSGSAVLLAGE
jgi:hypothetical protein